MDFRGELISVLFTHGNATYDSHATFNVIMLKISVSGMVFACQISTIAICR